MTRKQFSKPNTTQYEFQLTFNSFATSSLAITDSVSHDTDKIDLRVLNGEKAVMIMNTLNQSVNIYPVIYNDEGLNGTLAPMLTLGAGGWAIYTSNDMPILKAPIGELGLRFQCPTPPTTGAIAGYIFGVSA